MDGNRYQKKRKSGENDGVCGKNDMQLMLQLLKPNCLL